MGIKIPGYRLQAKYVLPSFRKRLAGPLGGRKLSEELNLTSLIDLFSTLILYLITTFSATGEILIVQKGMKLPVAQYAKMLVRSPIVVVTPEGVALEGANVGSNAGLEGKIEEKDWEMPKLRERLRVFKQTFELAQPGIPFPGNIIVEADTSLDFVYLKRVLFALVSEGYNGINLVVRGEGRRKNTAGAR
jgi:biopolymer transport protein ExbD